MFIKTTEDSYYKYDLILPAKYSAEELKLNAPYKFYMGEGADCVIVDFKTDTLIYCNGMLNFNLVNQLKYNFEIYLNKVYKELMKEGDVFLFNMKTCEVIWNFTKNTQIGAFGYSSLFGKTYSICIGKDGNICRINCSSGLHHLLWIEEQSKNLIKTEDLETTSLFKELVEANYGLVIGDFHGKTFKATPEKTFTKEFFLRPVRNLGYKKPKILVEGEKTSGGFSFLDICKFGIPHVKKITPVNIDVNLEEVLHVKVSGGQIDSQGYLTLFCDSIPDWYDLSELVDSNNILIRTPGENKNVVP